jgi:hypothetical protein
MIKVLCGLGLCYAFSGVACADATLELGDGVVVTAIDGQALNLGLFSPTKTRYVLATGSHTFGVRFEKLYDLNADDHDVVKSASVNLQAVALADQQAYQLRLVNPPNSHHRAQQYAREPIFVLQDAQGQTVLQQQGKRGQASASVLSGVNQMLGRVADGVSGAAVIDEPTAMQQFKALWQAASVPERKAMLSYAQVHLKD